MELGISGVLERVGIPTIIKLSEEDLGQRRDFVVQVRYFRSQLDDQLARGREEHAVGDAEFGLEDGVPGAAEEVVGFTALTVKRLESLNNSAKIDALLFLKFLLSLGKC